MAEWLPTYECQHKERERERGIDKDLDRYRYIDIVIIRNTFKLKPNFNEIFQTDLFQIISTHVSISGVKWNYKVNGQNKKYC